MAIFAVFLALPLGPERIALEKYLTVWRHIKPGVTGHTLKELGIEPGARYKQLLTELRRAWLDGDIKTEKQEQLYLQSLLRGEARAGS